MTLPCETQRAVGSDSTLAVVVYLLYGAGYFTGFSALVGVIIAHVKVMDADPVLQSHYRFQIRTFWIGLSYLVIGVPLCAVLIGGADRSVPDQMFDKRARKLYRLSLAQSLIASKAIRRLPPLEFAP